MDSYVDSTRLVQTSTEAIRIRYGITSYVGFMWVLYECISGAVS
jgi:hypothetical protein